MPITTDTLKIAIETYIFPAVGLEDEVLLDTTTGCIIFASTGNVMADRLIIDKLAKSSPTDAIKILTDRAKQEKTWREGLAGTATPPKQDKLDLILSRLDDLEATIEGLQEKIDALEI